MWGERKDNQEKLKEKRGGEVAEETSSHSVFLSAAGTSYHGTGE